MEDGIAIVGMGCRLPGEIKSIPQFWDFLSSGRSAQSTVPENRFNIKNWYHPDPKRFGGIASTGGYFLSQDESYRQFDPSFFGIHPLEAASMDPQQRKLLEVVFETFESAGVSLQQASGSRTACYVGAFTHDFKMMNTREVEDYAPYFSTGSDMTVLSNRINYVFNLKGPSLTVDTACSSSLYALHLACQGLRAHDFDAAIVAGTNIITDVRHQIVATKLGILSPTSTCHTFDESADGFGRAEGITAIYIKRVKDAYQDLDPIRAVIRASAINTNGKGIGITHPGLIGQQEVIRQAYAKAGLDFRDTGYVECHGTGTPVGDPIEVEAIGECFAESRTSDSPLLLSALKSQIGHTEGASGVAGVQKAVLSMEHGMIPATIGISRINAALNLRDGRIQIVQQLEKWPCHLNTRRASVNSFGYGGANAHVIIDDSTSFFASHLRALVPKACISHYAYSESLETHSITSSSVDHENHQFLLVNSAHTQASLERNINALPQPVNKDWLVDLAYTLAGKTRFRHRGFAVATSFVSGVSTTEWKLGTSQPNSPTIAFVFTGQGAQWPQMGIELIKSFAVASSTFTKLQECLNTIGERPEWTLHQALFAEADHSMMMKDVVVSVTLCAALQLVLVDLLKSWGIRPTAVVGHSSGEAAAAYCAGYLTLSEAIITSYYRALSLKKNPLAGLMMAAGLSAEQATKLIQDRAGLHLACHNSPQSVTIAGEPEAIIDLEEHLQSLAIFARVVKSSGFANHSPLVQNAADYFVQHFSRSIPESDILGIRNQIAPMYSCITGSKISSADLDAMYWSKNIAAPVLFDEALQSLLQSEKQVDLLIELGPHSALAGPIRQVKEHLGERFSGINYLPTIIRGSNNVTDLLTMAGNLFNFGYDVDLERVNQATLDPLETQCPKLIVDLPCYQWTYAKEIQMVEQRFDKKTRFRKYPRHDLLGSSEPASTPNTMIWHNRLSLSEVPWMKDHLIGTSILFPASGYIAMAIEAMTQRVEINGGNASGYQFLDVDIMRPLVLTEDKSVELIFELVTKKSETNHHERFEFLVSSVSRDDQWIQYAKGKCAIVTSDFPNHLLSDSAVENGDSSDTLEYNIYKEFQHVGLKYGPCFRTLSNLELLRNKAARARINLQPTKDASINESRYIVHPATMDGCLQAAFAANASTDNHSKSVPRAFLPKQIVRLDVHIDSISKVEMFADVLSKVNLQRPHSIDAGFQLLNANGSCSVDGVVRLIAADGISNLNNSARSCPEPYQRSVWVVDIDSVRGLVAEEELARTTLGIQAHDKRQHELDAARTCTEPDALFDNQDTDPEQDLPLHSVNPRLTNQNIGLSALVQLIAYKRPNLRYLETGTHVEFVRTTLNSLHGDSRYPFCDKLGFLQTKPSEFEAIETILRTYQQANALCLDYVKEEVDVIILTDIDDGLRGLKDILLHHRHFHVQQGYLIIASPASFATMTLAEVNEFLEDVGYSNVQAYTKDFSLVLARPQSSEQIDEAPDVHKCAYVIYQTESSWIKQFMAQAEDFQLKLNFLQLSEVQTLPKGARVISLLEAEEPFLIRMTDVDLSCLQKLFTTAARVEWVCSTEPENSLFSGMAKTLTMEISSLSIQCVQVDNVSTSKGLEETIKVLQRQLLIDNNLRDEKYVKLCGNQIMIMRYTLDEVENQEDLARSSGMVEKHALSRHHRLAISNLNQTGSYVFLEDETINKICLAKNQIRIKPIVYGMNTQNVSTLQGHNTERWLSHECLGKVLETNDHSNLQKNDFVLHLGGTLLGGEEVVDEALCIPCKTEQEGRSYVLLLESICTAYYSLIEVGHVRKEQQILIFSDDDLLVSVLRSFAGYLGIEVTVLQINETQQAITSDISQPTSDAIPITNSTKGDRTSKRLSVVIDTVGHLEISSISHQLGPSTKLIRVGPASKFSTISASNNNMLRKGVSISYFDIIELAESETDFIQDILVKSIEFAKSVDIARSIPQPPLYSMGDLSQAVQDISSPNEISKVGLQCESKTLVPVHNIHKSTFQLRPNGAYLLVGCLGGLGRSITNWMLERGARHLIFLSRSGADKAEARTFITKLQNHQDVTVQVISGNVTTREDVRKAVASANQPIHGVIQAASTFDVCHFQSMDIARFNKVIGPKVHGTLHLHEETIQQPLDFFVMTSSSIGIAGATTQSHYAAGNAFLDAFAQHRHRLGLPACSLSLGMVIGIGHVQETGIEEVLTQRGSYGISEAEFLRMMDVACSGGSSPSQNRRRWSHRAPPNPSLIITGLDPTKFTADKVPEWTRDDPSMCHIAHAVERLTPDSPRSVTGTSSSSLATLRSLLASGDRDTDRINEVLQQCIVQKLSSLISIPVADLEVSLHRPLSDLGMDSIVSSDFQAWARREVKVVVDFMEMLAGNQTIRSLVAIMLERMLGEQS